MKKSLNEWEKIVDTSADYDYYLTHYTKNQSGKCFGASLYWASDVLREIANDRKTIGLMLMNQHQFYNFSSHIHAIYSEMHARLEDNSSKLIVEVLNNQENFLSTRSNYKLNYSVINGETTKRKIDAMIKNVPSCRNTAIIFSMSITSRVKLIFKNQLFRHAVAILNHEGSVYFFDVNNGVYKLSNHHLFSLQGIADIIKKGFDTTESDLWELDKGTSHIFIRLETSGTINKNIMGFDYLSERVDWGYDSDDDME